MTEAQDRLHMALALSLAERAASLDEVPVGAVVAIGDRVVAAAHNDRERNRDPFGHAELLAMSEAAQSLGRWRLFDATLYVTLEPCPMCAGAIVNARIPRLVYAARDPKAGAVRSLFQLADDPRLNHRVLIEEGLEAERASELLKQFFKAKRKA